MYLNPHRWIIIIHVAFILQLKANAQSGQPGSQPGQNPSKTTVFAVFLTVIFFIGILSVYIRHCSRPNPQYSTGNYLRRRTNNHSRRGGLETAVVESFPVFPYSSVKLLKLGSNDLECSICLNEFEDEETVRLLPICNHLFHLDCIDAWLYSHATCPVCRSDLTATIKPENAQNDPHVVIDVDDEERFEKFPRSNSTGHSMGRFSDGFERFTLRLPEDVKRRIVAVNGRRLKRARSFDFDLTVDGNGSGGLLDRVNWVDRFGLFVAKSNFGSVR